MIEDAHSEPIALTDDEALALSARAGRNWPTATPTVANEGRAVGAAVTRGIRSLMVRGLLLSKSGEDVLDLRLNELVEPILDAPSSLVLFWVTGALEPLNNQQVVALHLRKDGHRVREIVSPIGIHVLESLAADDAADLVTGVIEQTHRMGIPTEIGQTTEVSYLGVLARGADAEESPALVVRRGEIIACGISAGAIVPTQESVPAKGDAILDHLAWRSMSPVAADV